jgi:hypothetical protein
MNKLMMGKLPKKEDSRNLKFAKYLSGTLPAIPKQYIGYKILTKWGMMLNDKIGDCTIAGAGHLINAWTSGKTIPPDYIIQKVYSDISGYDPTTGNKDDGCVELDVLNYWHKTGINGDTIGAFAEVNIKKEADIKAALYLFNGLYIGVNLPSSAEYQFQKGEPWKVVKGAQIVGGHCIVLVAYDETYYYAVTWGDIVKIEKAWLKKYMDEAYAIISQDYIQGGKTLQGYNIPALTTDMRLISK